jgi:hypothetical protein
MKNGETPLANLPALTPTNFAEAMQFAEVLSKSTMVPREYQRQPANILLAVQWGAELGLGPLQAINSIAIINGKPAVYGDAMLALVRGSPLCLDVIEAIKGEGDLACAVCDARRRGANPVVRGFSVADAKAAGLWAKPGPWKQYPTRMLAMRARGFALRDAFPDVLRGIISAEEAADIPREPRDITPQSPMALADALDAFAAEDTVNPETAIPRPLDVPTEAEIERSQERIEAVLGEDESAALDTENLLFAARAAAFDGRAAFGKWYGALSDDQRVLMRPHIGNLQHAARQADAPAQPHSEPVPAPDRPRRVDFES